VLLKGECAVDQGLGRVWLCSMNGVHYFILNRVKMRRLGLYWELFSRKLGGYSQFFQEKVDFFWMVGTISAKCAPDMPSPDQKREQSLPTRRSILTTSAIAVGGVITSTSVSSAALFRHSTPKSIKLITMEMFTY